MSEEHKLRIRHGENTCHTRTKYVSVTHSGETAVVSQELHNEDETELNAMIGTLQLVRMNGWRRVGPLSRRTAGKRRKSDLRNKD
jgi:hypothetical protein